MSYLNEKVVISNIFYMLSYTFQTLDLKEYKNLGSEDFEDVQELYAEIIRIATAKQLKQGLYREYVPIKDNIMTKRGTLDIAETINNRMHNNRRLCCNYDDYSEDNLYNRILKTAIICLSKSEKVNEKRRNNLRQILVRFANVKELNPQTIPWSALQYRRNSGLYQTLLTICRYAIEDVLLQESGSKRIKSISNDESMQKLYEHFILYYYKKHYHNQHNPCLKIKAKQIPWDTEDEIQGMPIMQSDVLIEDQDRALIIDAKLYLKTMDSKMDSQKKTFHSQNLYQIFTYVNNHVRNTGKQVSGMLLYAKTDEDITPDAEFSVSGMKYVVTTLDLNQPFSEISQQLDRLITKPGFFEDAVKK